MRTLSTTVSSRKRRMFWKVRAIPRRVISCGGSPVISPSSSETAPRSGR